MEQGAERAAVTLARYEGVSSVYDMAGGSGCLPYFQERCGVAGLLDNAISCIPAAAKWRKHTEKPLQRFVGRLFPLGRVFTRLHA